MLGIDQFGQRFAVDPKAPRKSLMASLGTRHADKMYVDTKDGARHIGYIVRGHWVTLYQRWEQSA